MPRYVLIWIRWEMEHIEHSHRFQWSMKSMQLFFCSSNEQPSSLMWCSLCIGWKIVAIIDGDGGGITYSITVINCVYKLLLLYNVSRQRRENNMRNAFQEIDISSDVIYYSLLKWIPLSCAGSLLIEHHAAVFTAHVKLMLPNVAHKKSMISSNLVYILIIAIQNRKEGNPINFKFTRHNQNHSGNIKHVYMFWFLWLRRSSAWEMGIESNDKNQIICDEPYVLSLKLHARFWHWLFTQ